MRGIKISEIPNKDGILVANPHIDPKELAKVIEALRKLRDTGTSGSSYRLAQPYSRLGNQVGGNENAWTVHLGRSTRN